MQYTLSAADGRTAYYTQIRETLAEGASVYEFTLLSGPHMGAKAACFPEKGIFLLLKDTFSQDLPAQDFERAALAIMETDAVGSFASPLGTIFTEKIAAEDHLIICGAGHVSLAAIRIARQLGFRITVIDDRLSLCDEAAQAGADETICDDFTHALQTMNTGGERPYYVIVTRGHRYDMDCLREILKKESSYVGLMGSRARTAGIRKKLLEEGFPQEAVSSIHMPIGLSIGAQTPAEIAVSIAAEIISVRSGQKAEHFSREMLRTLTQDPDLPLAMAVITSKSGSGPRGTFTKMLVSEDLHIVGTIGGGCAESDIMNAARMCIFSGECRHIEINMSPADAAEDGLVCGGKMTVFIRPFVN